MDRLCHVQASRQDLVGVVGQNRGRQDGVDYAWIKLRSTELE